MTLQVRLRLTAQQAADEIARGNLVTLLAESGPGNPSESERRSWQLSIPPIVEALMSQGLGNTVMLFELKMPLNHSRADITLVGTHPDGRPSIVVIENKQWSQVSADDDDTRVIVPGLGSQKNPLSQAWGYARQLSHFVQWAEEARLLPIVNMHNGSTSDIAVILGLQAAPEIVRDTRMFSAGQVAQLAEFLAGNLMAGAAADPVADAFLNAQIAPTPTLMAAVRESVRERPVFILQDDQRSAFDAVVAAVERSSAADHKEAILVVGGPGTGKSVIAVELLGELSRRGRRVIHATGSKSFTQTLRRTVGGEAGKDAFVYFNSFSDMEPNRMDVLLCDEAHRIRQTSTSRFRRTSGLQIDELLSAARVPVFLLDDSQSVRRGEIGSSQLVREACAARGITLHEFQLREQFRCAGSDSYLAWVDALLGINGAQPQRWNPEDTFELGLAPSVEGLERSINDAVENGRLARMVAGFCWPWSDPLPNGALVPDVTIGDWARPWNANTEKIRGDYPPSHLWATDPRGLSQVGCIYTAQGFEFDHVGVIWGKDLVWREDKWVANRAESFDRGAKGDDFDRNVRNSYRVLLTRGLESAVVYAEDRETADLLVSLGVPVLP